MSPARSRVSNSTSNEVTFEGRPNKQGEARCSLKSLLKWMSIGISSTTLAGGVSDTDDEGWVSNPAGKGRPLLLQNSSKLCSMLMPGVVVKGLFVFVFKSEVQIHLTFKGTYDC